MSVLHPDVIKLVKEAIRLEIKGRAFFLYAAEVTENSLGKKMFERLASEEVEHMKAFGQLFTEATGDEEWKKFVRGEERESSHLIEKLKERMSGAGKKKGGDELEALRIGMELERSAIDFFTRLAAESSAPTAKELAEEICEQEKTHYDLLQAQYDSVHNAGFWLDDAEFRLDGEY